MAVLGVMLAIASAKVGGERHELVKSMVEQENAHSRYVTQDLKHRVAVISLRELRATLPILSSKAGGRKEDAQEGKSPSTQAGEFVREEIHHVREGKHGASSPQQAIAIGLSKARRSGVKLPPPKGPAAVRRKAEQDEKAGENPRHKTSRKRSRAVSGALKKESRKSASRKALSGQARKSAAKRSKSARSAAAQKAARTRRAA